MEPSPAQSSRNADARALLELLHVKRPRGTERRVLEIKPDASALGMDRDRLIEAADRLTRLGYCKKVGMTAYSITPEGVDAAESPAQLDADLPVPGYDPTPMASPRAPSLSAAPPRGARLTILRADARTKLEAERAIGSALAETRFDQLGNGRAGEKFGHSVETWIEVTAQILRSMFDTDAEAEKFEDESGISATVIDGPRGAFQNDRERVSERVRRLDSLIKRLDYIEERGGSGRAAVKAGGDGRSVFVVHGHDVAAKQKVARMIEKLRLKAVILDEQPNKGRTIIEKFEEEARACAFAVVLLTADDVGRAKSAKEDEPRARQNVIFEMGFFMAHFGRGHVCALVQPGLKQPSDIHGIGWIELDDADGWQMRVAKEMKSAGLDVDLNDL